MTSTTEGSSQGFEFGLEHGIVMLGFILGFVLVFVTGLVYLKFVRVQRFKLLDNGAAGRGSVVGAGGAGGGIEAGSLVSSRNSSIRPGQSPITSPVHEQQVLCSTTIPMTPRIVSDKTAVLTPAPVATGVPVPSAANGSPPPPPPYHHAPGSMLSPSSFLSTSSAQTPMSPTTHSSYVDQRGRTLLKPTRELPV